MFRFERITDPVFNETEVVEQLAEKLNPILGIGNIEGVEGTTIFIRKKTDQAISLKDYFYPKTLNIKPSEMSDFEKQQLTNLIKLII